MNVTVNYVLKMLTRQTWQDRLLSKGIQSFGMDRNGSQCVDKRLCVSNMHIGMVRNVCGYNRNVYGRVIRPWVGRCMLMSSIGIELAVECVETGSIYLDEGVLLHDVESTGGVFRVDTSILIGEFV